VYVIDPPNIVKVFSNDGEFLNNINVVVDYENAYIHRYDMIYK